MTSRKKRTAKVKILGLDTSSSRTGFSVIRADLGGREKVEFLKHGSFSLNPKDCVGKRIVEFRDHLRGLIKKHKPHVVAAEMHHIRFVKTAKTLLKFMGIVVSEAYDATGVELDEISQRTIRSVLGCKSRTRKEAKEEVRQILERDHGIEVENDDESDAVAVALIAAGRLRKAHR